MDFTRWNHIFLFSFKDWAAQENALQIPSKKNSKPHFKMLNWDNQIINPFDHFNMDLTIRISLITLEYMDLHLVWIELILLHFLSRSKISLAVYLFLVSIY